MEKCPVCDWDRMNVRQHEDSVYSIFCERCGDYQITDEAEHNIAGQIGDRGYLISGYIRERNEANGAAIQLTADNLDQIASLAPSDVLEKLDRFILNLSHMSRYPGDQKGIVKERDLSLGYCRNVPEFNYLIEYLKEAGLVKSFSALNEVLTLTVPGWERVRELKKTSAQFTQAFVAMYFAPQLKACYDEGIRPAITEAGYRPYRIDRDETVQKIDERILLEIKRSRFLVADFTGQRAGVYFEAGYAMGLGIPVIWTCRKEDLKNCHFDTRQYNHIDWEKEAELRERLFHRIMIAIG